MNPIQDHDKNKEPADDEVGKIIWDRNPGREPEKEIPEDEDKDEDDTDENYRVPPVND